MNVDVRGRRGESLVRGGFVLNLFARGSHAELAPLMGTVLDRILRFAGVDSLPYYVGPEGYYESLSDDALALIERQMTDAAAPACNVRLSDTRAGAPGFYFEYQGRDLNDPIEFRGAASFISLWVPSLFVDLCGPPALRDFAAQVATIFPYTSGYLSPAFLHDPGSGLQASFSYIRDLWPRFTCLDVHHTLFDSADIDEHIRGAYWVNFLKERLGDAQDSRRLGTGWMITLEEEPQTGEDPTKLEPYRRFAAAINPYLHEGHYRLPCFSDQDMTAWRRRFTSL